MLEFLEIQYILGTVDSTSLKAYVPKWLTSDDYKTITGTEYTA